MNNPRAHKRFALFAFALLLVGVSLACFVWVRNGQQQYAINRQLIESLMKNDTKRSLALVEAGADPNTRLAPTYVPTFLELVNQLLHHAPTAVNDSPTALMIACGASWRVPILINIRYNVYRSRVTHIYPISPQLTQTMLLHGANLNAVDSEGRTALYCAVDTQSKIVMEQLLKHGADQRVSGQGERTLIQKAEERKCPEIVSLLRKYSKHP